MSRSLCNAWHSYGRRRVNVANAPDIVYAWASGGWSMVVAAHFCVLVRWRFLVKPRVGQGW